MLYYYITSMQHVSTYVHKDCILLALTTYTAPILGEWGDTCLSGYFWLPFVSISALAFDSMALAAGA